MYVYTGAAEVAGPFRLHSCGCWCVPPKCGNTHRESVGSLKYVLCVSLGLKAAKVRYFESPAFLGTQWWSLLVGDSKLH